MMKKGLPKAAIDDFTAGLNLQADDGYALLQRGACYIELGQPDAARQDLLRAKELGVPEADEYLGTLPPAAAE